VGNSKPDSSGNQVLQLNDVRRDTERLQLANSTSQQRRRTQRPEQSQGITFDTRPLPTTELKQQYLAAHSIAMFIAEFDPEIKVLTKAKKPDSLQELVGKILKKYVL